MKLANAAVAPLLDGVSPRLLSADVNVLVLSLHPDGLAPRIRNLPEWRRHILTRLGHEISETGDARLAELRRELEALPVRPNRAPAAASSDSHWAIAVPLLLETRWGLLSLLSTTTTFGTAVDATLADLRIEAFFPANRETTDALARMAEARAAAEPPS